MEHCFNYILKAFISQIKGLGCLSTPSVGVTFLPQRKGGHIFAFRDMTWKLFHPTFHWPEDSYKASPGSKEAEKHSLGQDTRSPITNSILIEGEKTMFAITGILLHSPCKSAFASIFPQVQVGNICLVVNIATGRKQRHRETSLPVPLVLRIFISLKQFFIQVEFT